MTSLRYPTPFAVQSENPAEKIPKETGQPPPKSESQRLRLLSLSPLSPAKGRKWAELPHRIPSPSSFPFPPPPLNRSSYSLMFSLAYRFKDFIFILQLTQSRTPFICISRARVQRIKLRGNLEKKKSFSQSTPINKELSGSLTRVCGKPDNDGNIRDAYKHVEAKHISIYFSNKNLSFFPSWLSCCDGGGVFLFGCLRIFFLSVVSSITGIFQSRQGFA